MFVKLQDKTELENYSKYLKLVGSLSNLFSESKIPYLYYRAAEKVFCKAFLAEDLSRSDISVDAKKENLGIGLKTFLIGNSKTFQKIAEFNKNKDEYDKVGIKEKIIKISQMRNERISFSERAFGITNNIYHCVVRDNNVFRIYEESMDKIDIKNIQDVTDKTGSIVFNDGINEYSFMKSKSTLAKRFNTLKFDFDINVEVLDDPLALLERFVLKDFKTAEFQIKETVYLRLYSRNKTVFPKSGLNQWNAGGRDRDPNEVYIPIPAEIHHYFPDFFPGRDKPFNLKLPDGNILQSKVCQDNNKALMSYSNRELGLWLLRNILHLKEGELLTYEKLQIIGIDSVRIDKIDEENFEINFSELDSYENFIVQFHS